MKGDPCTVCEGTDLKLHDGFYYCVECGTQNTNVRETVVEQKALGDGTFAIASRRKIVKLHDSKVQMSGEWYKWHAFNFIIVGLADELVALGAKPTFKIKLLWIWTRYIKKYQKKNELGLSNKNQEENQTLASFLQKEVSGSESEQKDDELDTEGKKKPRSKNIIVDGSKRDIRQVSRGLILSMLYLALNLDKSQIQLSHLYRFIKENRLNFSNLDRYVPEDIDLKSIGQWFNFLQSKICSMHKVRALSMSLLRKLNLGPPIVPDLKKMVDNILAELCLPHDLKPLIFSLMHYRPCDFLDLSNRAKEHLVRVPDYEAVTMAYIIVAMKMCFGLDNNYEIKLSNVVNKINEERNLSKSHRIGKYSESSSRLFSFKEWCSYLQFRKIVLCKNCLFMSDQNYLDIDDYVYLEHMEELPVNKKELQDETAHDLISKIHVEHNVHVIPKHLFVPTLTPLTDYTDIIIEYTQDPDKRVLLSEDFTQYSLKYACEDLNLEDESNFNENIVKGVSENGKTVKADILGSIVVKKSKTKMVYVKNCENRNWMITNPPTIEHVTCDGPQNDSNDKESDLGYDSENPAADKDGSVDNVSVSRQEKDEQSDKDSNIDNVFVPDKDQTEQTDHESHKEDDNSKAEETVQNKSKEEKHVIITEEDADKNIFDDNFIELDAKDEAEQNFYDDLDQQDQQCPDDGPNAFHDEFPNDDLDNASDISEHTALPAFNPDTFDREKTIKELILMACSKYKIPIPVEYKPKEPRKRKTDMFGNVAGPSSPVKRTKIRRGDSKRKVQEIMNNYYNQMHWDAINTMQQELGLAIRKTTFEDIMNGTPGTGNEPSLSNYDQNNERVSDFNENASIGNGNQSIVTPQNDVEQPDASPEEDLDENLEATLFDEDDQILLDQPKGDPKFDEEMYDVKQLYIKIKPNEDVEEDIFDLKEDPKFQELITSKVEENRNSRKFSKLKAEPYKSKYESDSEDEIPLKAILDERKMYEDMMAAEENYEPLINKEFIPDFKYWIRHYDRDYMTRSMDLHKKFDEELKENTPASFYFVLQECASIINCSTFYLYKELHNLEQYCVIKAKNPD
ncbi:unnamed protein product [Chrysodeixis includens]|uniref:Rrn7/TAF1B C-terminal cyclin domain-containing protein n=1 Tax=Chrysodeixis includens TaxID=689277 RepID=A0A9P0FTA5_CHRIL|nr:unnamed protein product [Chrysodeixis includens]